jgi:hypothetical protein
MWQKSRVPVQDRTFRRSSRIMQMVRLLPGECRLMEWSGRAPAPSAIEAGKGRQRQGARYVSNTQNSDGRN